VHNNDFLAFPCSRQDSHSRRRIQLLGVLQGIPGQLLSMPAEFVSASMICLAVRDSSGSVGVRCQIVKFCGLIV
jgi:hypothetical protein